MKQLKPIREIIQDLGIDESDVPILGKYIAKLDHKLIDKLKEKKDGKLILVTAITPTSAGEGKTTTTIGLSMGLARLGKKVITCLREPSLGPVFGVKGGACGGGKSTVEPMDRINLHFTGDIHAVTSAHNLLSACLDNHIYHGNELGIDPNNIYWKRAMDMNERSLRKISYKIRDIDIESGFDITAASEIMAILCLAKNMDDLKKRMGDIIIGLDKNGNEVKASQLKVVGAMAALLKHAIDPNLVQTIENTPVLIHGGPFGNIAHGTNSIIATKLALRLSDYVVTEAGFGADLGAEKFFGIVCRIGNFKPSCVVLVATIRALKLHGGAVYLKEENIHALRRGIENLEKQVENVRNMNINVLIAINKFDDDSKDEISFLQNLCSSKVVPDSKKSNICYPGHKPILLMEVFQKGSLGAIEVAENIINCDDSKEIKFQYDLDEPIINKIENIAKRVYGAKNIIFTEKAQEKINNINKKYYNLPICVAKTQSSLSDNPKLLGRPKEFTFTVTDIRIAAGAGYIVVYAGNIMTMPGLPRHPSAESIDVGGDGEIKGIF